MSSYILPYSCVDAGPCACRTLSGEEATQRFLAVDLYLPSMSIDVIFTVDGAATFTHTVAADADGRILIDRDAISDTLWAMGSLANLTFVPSGDPITNRIAWYEDDVVYDCLSGYILGGEKLFAFLKTAADEFTTANSTIMAVAGTSVDLTTVPGSILVKDNASNIVFAIASAGVYFVEWKHNADPNKSL